MGRDLVPEYVSAHTDVMIEIVSVERTSDAPAAAFFARWIDHASWSAWSPDTDRVQVDGPVRVGARGTLKPTGGPALRFVVAALVPGREYTDVTRLPGARLTFQHLAESVGGRTVLRVRVTVTGPLARLWSAVLGAGFRTSAPQDLDRLVGLVEAGRRAHA